MIPDLRTAFFAHWAASKRYRVGLILALIYLLFRAVVSVFWLGGAFEIEGWSSNNDLRIYTAAADNFWHHRDLYDPPSKDVYDAYTYSPTYALAFGWALILPYEVNVVIAEAFHLFMLALLVWRWYAIFRRYNLKNEADQLIRLLPLWCVFSSFMMDITFLNVYIPMALLATLLIEAILAEHLGYTLLIGVMLLLVKPYWAFALGVPVLLGHWRFAIRVILGSVLSYLAVSGLTILISGGYGQYADYLHQLRDVPNVYPWNTLSDPGHYGYNHSIMQGVYFFLEAVSSTFWITTAIKLLLTLPLLAAVWVHKQPENVIRFSLEAAFALYTLAFLWIDITNELTLGVAIFIYASAAHKIWFNWLFLPMALLDLWSFLSIFPTFFVDLPELILYPDAYIPFTLINLLFFYGLFIRRLFTHPMPQISLAHPAASDLL